MQSYAPRRSERNLGILVHDFSLSAIDYEGARHVPKLMQLTKTKLAI